MQNAGWLRAVIAALVSTKFAGHDSLFFCFLALPMMGSTGKTTDGCFQGENEDSSNNAVHTKPPITRFANGERVSGGSVTAAVMRQQVIAVLSEDELNALLAETEVARSAYFESLGRADGNWQPIVNPRFTDGPAWPTRPGWQRIFSDSTTMIASSGLTDPWFESESANHGLGVEILVATSDTMPTDLMEMTGTWLYQFATAISNAAATDGQFALRYQKFGCFLFGIPQTGIEGPSEWLCYDDCFGFLLGVSMPGHNMQFSLPNGDAQLLPAKLLTPAEYRYVAEHGLEGAQALLKAFAENGSHHLSSIKRDSVV